MTRMRHLAIATAVLLAATAGNAAFAQTDLPSMTQNRATFSHKLDQQVNAMDGNQDGRISKPEYDTYWKRQFRQSDTNHDGKLSKAEGHAAAKRLNAGKLPDKTRFEKRWNAISHNGTLGEPTAMAWHDRLFKQADANHDGHLTRDEMREAMSAHNGNVDSL